MDKSELEKQLEHLDQGLELELELELEQEQQLDQEQQQRQQELEQELRHVMGVAGDASQMAHSSHHQTAPMVTSGTHAVPMPSPMQPPIPSSSSLDHLAYQMQEIQEIQQQLQQQLQMFWENQMQEIQQTSNFKNHCFPLSRIRTIMKADEDVWMMSAEVPVIFAKACELFCLELTMRSWIHAEENMRRTLQKDDIKTAVSRNKVYDFLPLIDELEEEGLGTTEAIIPIPNDPIPPTPQHPVGPTGMLMGTLVDQATLYPTQQPHPLQQLPPQQPWPHPQPLQQFPPQQPWPHPLQHQPPQQPWPYPQPQQPQPPQQPWPHPQPQQQLPPQQPWPHPQPQQSQPPQQPWPYPQPQQSQPPQQPESDP